MIGAAGVALYTSAGKSTQPKSMVAAASNLPATPPPVPAATTPDANTPSTNSMAADSSAIPAAPRTAAPAAPAAPAPRAQFNVLDTENLNALVKVKSQQPSSHLVLGLMYARAGLLAEAQSEFRQLVKENPDSVEAMRLLQTVQQWQRR